MSSHTLIQLWSLLSLLWPTKDYGWISHIVLLMHVHNVWDITEILGCRPLCCCGILFVLAVPFSPVATFCGWRLGEGECSSQLPLYLCPAVDSPLSAALSPAKRAPSFLWKPNLSRSLIQIGVILSRGPVSASGDEWLQRKGDEKAKCRWSLISFEELYTSSFSPPTLYLMIPFPFFYSRSSRCPVDLSFISTLIPLRSLELLSFPLISSSPPDSLSQCTILTLFC